MEGGVAFLKACSKTLNLKQNKKKAKKVNDLWNRVLLKKRKIDHVIYLMSFNSSPFSDWAAVCLEIIASKIYFSLFL